MEAAGSSEAGALMEVLSALLRGEAQIVGGLFDFGASLL